MTSMTPRERVAAALSHREPDRVPISVGGSAHKLSTSRYKALKKHFGIEGEGTRQFAAYTWTYDDSRLLDALGVDFRYVYIRPPRGFQANMAPDRSFVDEWGLTNRIVFGQYDFGEPPLAEATIDDLDNYPWPDPSDPARVAGLFDEVVALCQTTGCAITAYRPTLSGIFDMSRFLIGTERILTAMLLDTKFVEALFSKLAEVLAGFYAAYLDKIGPYVQIVEMADDYGTQRGPFFSPKLYRALLKARNAEVARIVKQKAPQAKFMLHSCGSVKAFIPDLIESGFDILNPVQPLAKDMQPGRLKAEFGRDIVFLGGVDVQQAMVGPVEQVRDEVRRRIEELAPGGGFVLAPAHNFGDEVPLENILAFFDTAYQYGAYR